MTFSEQYRSESGVPCPHALRTGLSGCFMLGILFCVLFLIMIFIKFNSTTIAVFLSTLGVTVACHFLLKVVKRTIRFSPDGLVISTQIFTDRITDRIPSSDITLISGAGEVIGGRSGRIRYFITIQTKFKKLIKPEFTEFTFEEINRNIQELAQYLGAPWREAEEYHYEAD